MIQPGSVPPVRDSVGSVIDSGERRKTPSGRPVAVWVTPEHARGGGGASDA